MLASRLALQRARALGLRIMASVKLIGALFDIDLRGVAPRAAPNLGSCFLGLRFANRSYLATALCKAKTLEIS
jgi:hypothetical protein